MDIKNKNQIIETSLKKRYVREHIFQLIGRLAILSALLVLVILFAAIFSKGYTAFSQTVIQLEITFDKDELAPQGKAEREILAQANYSGMIKKALIKKFPDVTERKQKLQLYALISPGAAFQLRDMVLNDMLIIGTTQKVWLYADDDIDMFVKGHIKAEEAQQERRVKDNQIQWLKRLESEGAVQRRLNTGFFVNGDSRDPELAGVWGATLGSFYTMLVTLLLSFPLGVATAIYLEEFAPTNVWTDIIEVNINNLAAVPSIVYGLLGLAVFLNFIGFPRSSPLVGGLVLTLMTLPTIIISARASLQSVPPSIREGALAVGASQMQSVFHHVLPLAMPGILTGTIIGMARALGETAPLLMIGMVAFIVDIPESVFSPSTALPVQIYLWADSPERAFLERTAAAIIVLLLFLLVMNALAIVLRTKFEKRL
jgi:phosphate transport system permease protein